MTPHSAPKRAKRPIDGLLLLDKPKGMSSNAALQRVKWLLSAEKAGHTGTLDPNASGLLPICLGEATKFTGYLLDTDKAYRAVLRLGVETDSGDSEGEIRARAPVPGFSPVVLEGALNRFRGEIQQIPPMHSALKHNGQRLYDLARRGVEVERAPRSVTIYELTCIEYAADRLEIDVRCSKGTYIRSLAQDLGRQLGCGAHLEDLRRTATGRFKLSQAVGLDRLANDTERALREHLLPADTLVDDLPAVQLTDADGSAVMQGRTIPAPTVATLGMARLYIESQGFIGIGEVCAARRLAPRRLLKPVTPASAAGGPSA